MWYSTTPQLMPYFHSQIPPAIFSCIPTLVFLVPHDEPGQLTTLA